LTVGFNSSIVGLVLSAGLVAKCVLFSLLLASVVSWAIILYKWITLRRAEAENRRFLILFSKTDDLAELKPMLLKLNEGPMALLFQAGLEKINTYLENPSSENGDRPMRLKRLERTLQSGIQDEMGHQERYLHFLATVGNVAPFVGLFGTVWGIMNAFQEIGRQGSANIASVAPGVAEALVTTAAGLLAAIPAVIAYNVFVNKLRKMELQLEVFSSELVSLIEEKIVKAQSARSGGQEVSR
jgi:biopolymer transport protein TolQ